MCDNNFNDVNYQPGPCTVPMLWTVLALFVVNHGDDSLADRNLSSNFTVLLKIDNIISLTFKNVSIDIY